MEPRLMLAYAIIAACGLVGAAGLAIYLPRRRQKRLRRRGIKSQERSVTRG